ncbi:hypothetical protein [Reichenbachiella versicolor]|uniref:hypothetical protein n=1 Tax=Reichenbachiella versicolor TaxID=1821036 RepID=UPI000D6EA1BA|nr:hypothetical protein [Reichenbachiella versicolor]
MKPILKNILAVLVGLLYGSAINMAIVTASSYIIPPPEGADITTMEGLKESIHLFQPKHFIMPFLAHALGTLNGAVAAALIATNRMTMAIVVGVFFLIGGIINIMMLPSPLWFNSIDLIFAYIPMAWLGGKTKAKIF